MSAIPNATKSEKLPILAVTTPGSEPRQRRPARRGLGVGVVVVAAGKAVFTVGGLARAESEGVPAGGSGSGDFRPGRCYRDGPYRLIVRGHGMGRLMKVNASVSDWVSLNALVVEEVSMARYHVTFFKAG